MGVDSIMLSAPWLHTCVLRVTKLSRILLTSASSPTSTYRIRSRRMSAYSKVFLTSEIHSLTLFVCLHRNLNLILVRSGHSPGLYPFGDHGDLHYMSVSHQRPPGTCLNNCNGDKHDYASDASCSRVSGLHNANLLSWRIKITVEIIQHLHRTAIREKFFPVQSADGIRNSGGVPQDHLSHQTLL